MFRVSVLAGVLLCAVALSAGAQDELELPTVDLPQLRTAPPTGAPVRATQVAVEPVGGSATVQERLGLAHGTRVQLQANAAGTERITADVVAFRRDGFSIASLSASLPTSAYRSSAGARIQHVQFREVGFMRVSQGHSRVRSAVRGALWGLYVAGSAGTIAGPVAAHSMGYGIGGAAAILGVSGGAIGAGLGAVFGAIVSPERWKSYRLVSVK